MSDKLTCQVCSFEFNRTPNVESYGGRVCPRCLEKPDVHQYFQEIFGDESDLSDWNAGFRAKEIEMQRQQSILEEEGEEGLKKYLRRKTGFDT